MKSGLKLKNFIFLTFAGIINSIGITIFLSPISLLDSGMSGLAMLLEKLTPSFLSLSVFLIVLNTPLFIYGYKKQGKVFTLYALFSVAIYSISSYLIRLIFPEATLMSPFTQNDIILSAVFGGLISGVGSGLAIRNGGAMDGIEVLSVIFSKRLGISTGTFVMIFNVILYIAAGLITKSWVLPLYSIIAYAVSLKAVDFLVEGINRSKAAFIVTSKGGEVSKVLSSEMKTGITVIEGRGYYSNSDKEIIYIVLNRFQIPKMKDLVHLSDPAAYISVFETADVMKGVQEKV